jgi:hypothetical protein
VPGAGAGAAAVWAGAATGALGASGVGEDDAHPASSVMQRAETTDEMSGFDMTSFRPNARV